MTNHLNVLLTFVRGHRTFPKAWNKDVVKYDLIKYLPCKKDHVDPPITPSKILMVYRVKPFKGNPYWEKKTLKILGFDKDEKKNYPVFVKNTPEMCSLLWSVKHLIKIVPVKLPKNLPNTIDDYREYYIHDNGTIHFGAKINPERYQATIDYQNSIKVLKTNTIKEKLRLLWLNGSLM
ncbi:large ribosomal subunit protein uL30m [Apis cerana]|uniref:Large ribosomal subunit protein uL30m n=1 Tax=Apis cerana cerana TaxID=94128 RepID=A0A2A3EH54_APICC|nr:large ribosomal subunit protein uL30m [Apis cerana]PBC30539.1 39S ribosomal protein L30 [Apis cerana cerana]